MYEIRELLEIGKGDAPPLPFEVDDIITAGRRRRRWSTARRIGGAGVAALVLVALGLFVTNPSVLSNDRTTVQPASSRAPLAVSIFLTLTVRPDQLQAIDARLRADPLVSGDPRFLDMQASYNLFLQAMKNDPALIASVTPEQVPQSFRVTLHHASQFERFYAEYKALPGVDDVIAPSPAWVGGP